jgi:hypothetical protein
LHGSPLRATPLQYLIQTEVVANHNGKKWLHCKRSWNGDECCYSGVESVSRHWHAVNSKFVM